MFTVRSPPVGLPRSVAVTFPPIDDPPADAGATTKAVITVITAATTNVFFIGPPRVPTSTYPDSRPPPTASEPPHYARLFESPWISGCRTRHRKRHRSCRDLRAPIVASVERPAGAGLTTEELIR